MAVYREPIRCLGCGEPLDAIHKDYKNYPPYAIPYGDSFIGWDYDGHKCKYWKKKKYQKRLRLVKES